MRVFAVHDQNSRTDLVDVIQETAVGICLRTDDTPTVIRVTATRMIATRSLVVIVVVLDKLRCIVRQWVYHASCHSSRVCKTLCGEGHTRFVTRLFGVSGIEITVTADAGHVVHRGSHRRFDTCIRCRRIEGNTTPPAYTDDTDAVCVHFGQFAQKIHRCHEIFRIDIR